ncbi:uncharacterized protein LOC129872425 [Solanum dulcamara]|uniref:uncharacterized protein LOC129872425 n=1 Tax=Solanum dulcamara TaxID=45834 RepID=UPI0024865896|nr:uncharacterized protein LOC129872425 [Solanum dulcamara]
MDFGGQWDQFFPLVEFAYMNNYHYSIQMAQFEALYGRRCFSPVGWFESTDPRPHGTNLMHKTLDHRRYIPDESHVLRYDAVDLDDRLRYIEELVDILARDVRQLHSRAIPVFKPIAILAKDVRQLHSKSILVIKVQWRNRPIEEATLETEKEMQE